MKRLFAALVIALGMSNIFAAPAQAQGEPFIGEIRFFAGNFAPRGWAFCDGQLVSIDSNQALFSILGTTYGGDGRTTFGLPDMRGRFPIHAGNGPGLPPVSLGQKGGAFEVLNSMPAHSHTPRMFASGTAADNSAPAGGTLGASLIYSAFGSPDTALNAGTIQSNTEGNPAPTITNMPPYVSVNCIIALIGTFPSRN